MSKLQKKKGKSLKRRRGNTDLRCSRQGTEELDLLAVALAGLSDDFSPAAGTLRSHLILTCQPQAVDLIFVFLLKLSIKIETERFLDRRLIVL